MLTIFRRALIDSWRATLGWAIGLLAAAFLYLPLFPSIGGSKDMQNLINSLPPALTKAINYDAIGTGAGYTQSTLFGLLGFVLLSMAAVAWGASAVGGDEEAGLLELTLAHAVTRVQVVLGRALAIFVRIAVLVALMFLATALLNGPAGLDINLGHLSGACLAYAGMIAFTASAALLGGALFGRRVHGLALGAFVAVAGYVFNAIGRQSQSLSWLLNVSPYHWFFGEDPFMKGVQPWAPLLFWGLAAVLSLLAALALHRRDVGR